MRRISRTKKKLTYSVCIYAHRDEHMNISRSVSCLTLLAKTMPSAKSCPARMHTMPLVAPATKPWAVVAVHVRARPVGDAYLASVRLPRAIERQNASAHKKAKIQSTY